MTELEVMQRAKMYLDKLAQGIDPISDQAVPGDSALNQPRLSKCFSYVSDVLGRVIANGGQVVAVARQEPFAITAQQLRMVQLSREPVRVTQLADLIAAAVNDPRMKKPSTTLITNWLLERGFLEKQVGPDGKNQRVPTPNGFAIGLSVESRQGQYGEYQAVFYNLNAQRFVLEHLMEMMQ